MQWTAERVDQLAQLWSEGFSARQIASRLGGITRNAVIGKAHRLSLQRGETRPQVVPEPPAPVVREPVLAPISEASKWMCRWPTEEPGKFGLHICGKTAQPGRPYCAEHLTAAYRSRQHSAA